MKKCRKKILAFSLAFVLATSVTSDSYSNFRDRIFVIEEIDDPHYIGSCFCGNVYFGSKEEMKTLYPEVKRSENPHGYYVDLTRKLLELKKALILEAKAQKVEYDIDIKLQKKIKERGG